MIPKICFLLFLLKILPVRSLDYDEIQIEDMYETRSRILMVDGNVWLHAGKDKNITFKTFGNGKIYVDETDVSRLPDTASFKQLVGRVDNANQMLLTLKSRQDTQNSALRVVLGSARHYLVTVRNLTLEVNSLKKWRSDKMLRDMRRRGLLVKMTRQIIKLNKLVAMNACETNKCSNGGTCIPTFGPKFYCLCPPHFTGQKCEADVDECDVYNGTIAGCQNNGTCVNKRGGFECECKSGFHGPLCQYQMSSCSKTFELCGPHGHCVETFTDPSFQSSSGSGAAYKCICDWGFKMSSDKENPTCVDVNECDSNPCHPGVSCINLPGSFMCSGCPKGYKMEGNACVDENECESEVPPCSPLSECHNTVGSFYCGPCPLGYSGGGVRCTKNDVCSQNKCHKLATCKHNEDEFSYAGGYTCYCPDGYVGDGIGENGCLKNATTVCETNDCVNGAKCRPISETVFNCDCQPGFYGDKCEKVSPCRENPCQNGGVCVPIDETVYCDCKKKFFGIYCEQQEEQCGEHFTHPTGNYTFDMDTSNTSSICDFVFNIPAVNSALKINFTWFDKFTQMGDGPTDCATTVSNLTLYDGPTDSYSVFATFCGDSHSVHAPLINTPITMTATKAMMRFRGLQGEFSISWKTEERKCGYRTSIPEGILSVPQNKQDVVCEWFISAPGGKIIEVSIPPVAMHSKTNDNCDQNSLEIYDGYSSFDRHRILSMCSSTLESQTIRSTGPFLTVSFISNMLSSVSGLETIRGFSLNYKFVTPDRECGGELDNVGNDFTFNGVIESPNFGSLYPPNMDCTWKINGTLSNGSYSGDMVLKLTFDTFDVISGYSSNGLGLPYRSFRRLNEFGGPLEFAPGFSRIYTYRNFDMGSCSNDYLKIHDGDGTMVSEACNPRKPPNTLYVNNPAAVLQFHSDGTEQGKGFRIQYEMLCQKRVKGNGTIQTWNFPNGGAAGTCTYIIEAPRTHVISLRLLTIGLKVLPMSECFYSPKPVESYEDYIELSGGRSDNQYFNKRYVCPRYPFVEGNWLSVSATRPLKITVGSSGNPQFKGLSLEYTTTDVGCGGLFSSMTGTVSSPNYPEKYLPHMHCVYQIFVSWSKVVKLTFDTFDLEVTSAKSCEYDRVEIYTTYHNETVHGDLLGKFCGSMLPPAIFSTTNQMTLVFVTDRSVAGQGFNAKFEAINRDVNCDYTFTSPSGVLEFSTPMKRFDKCTYHIAVHENQRVLLTMENMTIPCDRSTLQLRNGPAETSPPFTSLPGDSEICTPKVNYYPVLRSFSNRVTIILKSTDTRDLYFKMKYETVVSGCGGRIDGLSGVVAAPQYPLGDKRNLKCEWKVAVALGNKVRFSLTAIDDLNSADSAGFCPVFAFNRLDFFDSPRLGSKHLKRYCAKEMASEPITSDDNELVIKYAQSGGYQSKKIFGFSGHFTTLCTGIVLDDISGNIQSPGYPHRVYTNQFCSWTIRVPKGNRILVTMHHFVVQHQGYYYSNNCEGNMLKVEDTDLAEAEVQFKNQLNVTNSVNKYCERAQVKTIKSKHNVMKLSYTSHVMPTNQFWLSWTSLGCSSDVTQPGQITVTKDHIDPEVDDFECQYRIQAPIGSKILVKLHRFDIFPDATPCVYEKDKEFNGMAVFMGNSNASGVAFQTLCTPVSETNISSQTDQLSIYISLPKSRLSTKDNVFFNATIEFIEASTDTCGGVIQLERGVKNQLVSPAFPGPYPVGVVCRWLIRAPEGYHIEFTVDEYHSPNYHEERSNKPARYQSLGRGSNFTCKWNLPYSDGMLTFYNGNSSLTFPREKFCEESTTAKTFEMYASETLVVFEGATNLMGSKSGEEAKKVNGIRFSARPKCGGVVYAESKPQVISMFHEGEDVCNVTIKKRDSADSDIYIRLEEYSKINASSQHTVGDRIDIYEGDVLKHTELLGHTDTTMQEYSSSEEEMMISVQHSDAPHSAVIVYSTDERNCGGEVRHSQGTILAPTRRLDKPFDCAWTVTNNIGNTAVVWIESHNLASTPNCTDSYIEIRVSNSSGKLLKRQCDSSSVDTSEYEAQSLYLFLRYRPSLSDDDDEEEENEDQPVVSKKSLFMAKYKKPAGGSPKSRYVSNPVIEKQELVTWTLDVGDQTAGILVKFTELYLPKSTSYLRFSEAGENDDVLNLEYEEVSGVMLPAEKFFSTSLIRVYSKLEKTDKFSFTWDPVPLNYHNLTKEKQKEKKVYDCGGDLTPSYDWDYISSPLPPGQSYGYEENLHCRWVIRRPLFTGIELQFEHLDLENSRNCAYDFVTFRLQFDMGPEESEEKDIDFSTASKHCSLARSNQTFVFSVNRLLHIHFVTDKSRHGTGFKLKYRLSCNAFEHIRPGIDFEETLQSPNYNGTLSPREFKCQYSLIMESNRKLFVQILDLDIEEASPCASTDSLIVGNRYSDIWMKTERTIPMRNNDSAKFCGKLDANEQANFTTSRGRIFIRYNSGVNSRRGFKMIIKEVMAECPSGVLHLDDVISSRIIQSPEFPQKIPNSAECEYVMAAPNGHRVMLTFDPDNFDIDGEPNKCELTDYVEVRDGPSVHSQFLGRFCGNRPPSSIYSSGSFLYMKLHTGEYGRSRRFVAKFEIATCGGTVIVHENITSHITSPNFPDAYSSPIECEWTVRSPNTHMLEAEVNHMWLFYNQNCSVEQLTILDGNSTSPALIGPACVARMTPNGYTRSSTNQLIVQFSSSSLATRPGRQYCTGKKCGFDLSVKLSETKCGGSITDAEGSLKPPGFPGRLLPHVRCVWDFKAPPGFIYRIKLNFTAEDESRGKMTAWFSNNVRRGCLSDISLVEGVPPYRLSQFNRNYCKDLQVFDTKTDIARLIYDDSFTREVLSRTEALDGNETFYAPFTLDYLMVPAAASKGCTYLVKANETFKFTGINVAGGGVVVETLCHLRVEKPANFGSVSIRVTNYSFNPEVDKDTVMCLTWDAHLVVQSNEVPFIDKTICEATLRNNFTELVYINSNIDLIIIQAFRDFAPQSFNLTVEFQECGGVISTPNRGEITSPNYGPGKNYLPMSRCKWILEAPQGQIVKIKIVEMRIMYDHDCANDRLLLGEGRQEDMNTIHTYCHRMDGEQESKLEDRFKTIRSKGRHMTLMWITNARNEASGWKLQYEFVNEEDTCGYHTKGMSGTITTPNFGEKDYENNMECVWDIQVPLGYHVNLKYRDFDIETSANCENDKLVVSQEHSTRANSPNGDYYFLFQDEEKETALCGIEPPKDFDSSSNRVRLNFTTDEKTSARGFRIDWEAACGTIYRLNHGVITSPHYPEGYPNAETQCTYLIAPQDQNDVVALKFSEFDLSSTQTVFGRLPCQEDYLQIIEASTDRVAMTICGGSPMPSDPLTFKGPVGLKFVTNKSFIWQLDEAKMKRNAGFQLAYSINKCGGDIELREGTKLVTTVTSPAFPLPYTKELDCVWNITADSDRLLHVRFEEMDLEDFTDCTADFVELHDSSDIASNKSMGKFCGTMRKAPQSRLLTSGPNLLIRLKTDFNVNAGGFKMIVTSTLGPKSGCGGKLTATTSWQTLTNPKDDDGNYPPALMCGWSISGPVDTQLRIRIDGVDTEKLNYPPGVKPKPECIDALAVYDGQEFFSPPLATDVCTSQTPLPKMLFTSHRHAFVTFETDRDGTGKGFNISYALVDNECGGWLQAESNTKTLVYKGITKEENTEADKERTHQRCRFMITGSKTEPVIVTFTEFNIPSKIGDCSDAYVEIRDVGSLNECKHPACAREPNQRKITKLCGTKVPNSHISNTNTIQIIVSGEIVESGNKTKPSFKFDYNLLDNCNRTIDTNKTKSGRLTSPNYPHGYTENTTCVTKLESANKKLLIVFNEFSLEEPNRSTGKCEYDYLQLFEEGKNGTKYCGTDMPKGLLTSGADFTALFRADHSLNLGGYDATYFSVYSERDDRIEFAASYEMDGVFSTVGYPNGYKKAYTQVFILRPPASHDCSLIFSDLNIGLTKGECGGGGGLEEYMEIEIFLKGLTRKARVRDCTFKDVNSRELILEADTNDRYVKFSFQSDSKTENDGRGVKIQWSCHSVGRTFPISP